MDINVKKRTIANQKFAYQNEKWESVRTDSFILKKNYFESLSKQRKNLILTKIKNESAAGNIIPKLYSETKAINAGSIYHLDTQKQLYIFAGKRFNFDIDELKKVIKINDVRIVNFIFIDVKFDEGKLYQDGNDRLQILNTIKKSMEIEFNKFRLAFFSNPKDTETIDFKDVRFVLTVKPYWEVEFLL